eukprot:CCRYP_016631-RD/>CCRYP_016631-RD protein AED:0.05 eAED:0.08 QI:0/1/0.83/1/1/1/6/2324/1131
MSKSTLFRYILYVTALSCCPPLIDAFSSVRILLLAPERMALLPLQMTRGKSSNLKRSRSDNLADATNDRSRRNKTPNPLSAAKDPTIPTQPKPPHDRTIDRRKSPALWRHDMEYSLPSPASCTQPSSTLPPQPPELMSPAGGWTQLLAAVSNGADAVYLGLTSYSARARACNFDPDPSLLHSSGDGQYVPPQDGPASLAHAVQYCHRHRVRVYVAFNTLVFDSELQEVERLIQQVWDCGVDAVIVQDVGVARIVMEVVEGRRRGGEGGKGLNGSCMEIHASTQQSVTCGDGVEFARERTGATRVVLGRELSLSEITQVSTTVDTEIEVFVHGALCVSYSGQCFSSEAWGGRSANRGQCAQACRLPYGLIANGELKHLSFDGIEGIMGKPNGRSLGGGAAARDEEMGYLLSPQDLCGLDQVEELVKAGVSCLKIEGRLKDASYVAATTRAYRTAIDAAWSKVMNGQSTHNGLNNKRILASPDEHVSRNDLTHVFARGQDEIYDGLTPGFFEGAKHQRLVRGRSPRHRGQHLGRVDRTQNGALIVKLDERWLGRDEAAIKRGDGIVVDRGMPQEEELGGPVYEVKWIDSKDGIISLRFGRDVERRWIENDEAVLRGKAPPTYYKNGQSYGSSVSTVMAPKGSHVWITANAEIGNRMKRLASLDPPRFQAKLFVEGRVGEPLTIKIVDTSSGVIGEANSLGMGVLEVANGPGLEGESVRKAIGTLGGSQWSASKDDIDLSSLEHGIWCPPSWIKDVRRRALQNLEEVFASVNQKSIEPAAAAKEEFSHQIVDNYLDRLRHENPEPTAEMSVSVLARSYDQVDALCKMIESNVDANGKENHFNSTVPKEIIVDFLEIDGIFAAVERVKELKKLTPNLKVAVASPRIIKPGEEGIWRTLLKSEPDAILIRSSGLLRRLVNLGCSGVSIPELIGDFSLNAANVITAYELLQSGLNRITASYDLSASAITDLGNLLGKQASQLEVVVHQHMPIFHTEHCVFARFLSGGNSYQDCGHVCTRNTIHLRDQNGKDNLVLADMGCRNTVFNSASQSGVYSIDDWKRAGINRLRIELVDESGDDAIKIVSAYMEHLSGQKTAWQVWQILENEIRDSNGRVGGVDVGSLRNNAERRSGEVSHSF